MHGLAFSLYHDDDDVDSDNKTKNKDIANEMSMKLVQSFIAYDPFS